MPPIVVTLLSLLVGALLSIYLPMNSMVSKQLGSAITANITFFLMALLTSIVLFALWGDQSTLARLKSVPSYLYLTGFVSAFIVLATTYLIPHMGVRRFFILTISGQVLTAMIVSHYGLLATPTDPLSAKTLIGAALVVLGAVFSTL
jgi:transporter family-2 protein